jgi:hypothetical protein
MDKYSAAEALSMAMMWDGAMGTLLPAERCLAWRGGPRWWRNTIDWFVSHPRLTRSLAVMELGVGMWLTARPIK